MDPCVSGRGNEWGRPRRRPSVQRLPSFTSSPGRGRTVTSQGCVVFFGEGGGGFGMFAARWVSRCCRYPRWRLPIGAASPSLTGQLIVFVHPQPVAGIQPALFRVVPGRGDRCCRRISGEGWSFLVCSAISHAVARGWAASRSGLFCAGYAPDAFHHECRDNEPGPSALRETGKCNRLLSSTRVPHEHACHRGQISDLRPAPTGQCPPGCTQNAPNARYLASVSISNRVACPGACRCCLHTDAGCTHPEVASSQWCRAHCPGGRYGGSCRPSHCHCGARPAPGG